MSVIPWWVLLLVAGVFTLVGAATTYLVTARTDAAPVRRRSRRWYAERKAAYVELLAIFERDVARLRAAFDAGDKPGDGLAYVDVVAPALMQVRLLASGPVRNGALAVHMLLQQLHAQMNPSAVPGVRPETHFRELLAQVPLVMQHLEEAIRDELGIVTTPPQRVAYLDGYARHLLRPIRSRAPRK